MDALRIIFAGGGTGGHLFPALSVADEIKRLQPDTEIFFIGTKDKIEARIVPQKGYRFKTIWISGFRRSLHPANLLFPVKVVTAVVQAISIIKRIDPDAVAGTGGYVSGPVLRAAAMLKIPTLIQEQNSYPGATTRMLAGKVNEVHLTFESSRKYFPGMNNVFVTGNPTRSDLENVDFADACGYFGFDPDDRKKTLLFFGGSQGASAINESVGKCLDRLVKENLRIIWQTGKKDYASARGLAAKYPGAQVWVGAFIDRMSSAYAASDLVICRAGATTIAELTLLGKPAILVPYPHAAADHQTENAKGMAESGAAVILYENQLSGMFEKIDEIMKGTRLPDMSKESKKLGRPAAAGDIARRLIQLARRN